jgi:alkyl hydroperoxide reductase subunit AhpC
VELQRDVSELDQRGIKLVTISYDDREVLRGFTQQQDITYTMLADPGSQIIERFDLLNPVPEWAFGENADDPDVQEAIATYVSVVNPSERMIGIAFPGSFILDPDGVVLERHFEDLYIERNTISSVLLRMGEDVAPVQATEVSTLQLELTTYPSNPELAVGNRFSLVLDIEPNEGMHVYAPGASDSYTAITLDIEDQPYLRVLPMEFPESGDYYFEPFDETQAVYEEPFKLIREVYLDGSLEAQGMLRGQQSVTINGTLRYQACDENICYLPTTVPLTWTMDLAPLVFQPTQRAQ